MIRLQSVSREEAEGFAREIDAIYFETSAKTSLNVSRAFEAISRKLPTQQAPAFDSLADLRSPPIDPRLPRPGPRSGAGGGKPGGGCGCS
jgi:GTPase SAR1 family protein